MTQILVIPCMHCFIIRFYEFKENDESCRFERHVSTEPTVIFSWLMYNMLEVELIISRKMLIVMNSNNKMKHISTYHNVLHSTFNALYFYQLQGDGCTFCWYCLSNLTVLLFFLKFFNCLLLLRPFYYFLMNSFMDRALFENITQSSEYRWLHDIKAGGPG